MPFLDISVVTSQPQYQAPSVPFIRQSTTSKNDTLLVCLPHFLSLSACHIIQVICCWGMLHHEGRVRAWAATTKIVLK
jgi:hypothetical protein